MSHTTTLTLIYNYKKDHRKANIVALNDNNEVKNEKHSIDCISLSCDIQKL